MTVGTLVLLRHGESEWNAKNLFTGWVDVDLTAKGEAEARRGGELLREHGLLPDVVHTSVLRRAIRTAELALHAADRQWIAGAPVMAAQRAPLRRAAGQEQEADPGGVRRGAVHALAPVVRHAAAADRRRRRVVAGRRPALRDPAARADAAHRVPQGRPAAHCCRTGTTRSCRTCSPAARCWSPRTATRCARWSSTSTASPTRRSPGSTSRPASRCATTSTRRCARSPPGGTYLDPEAAEGGGRRRRQPGPLSLRRPGRPGPVPGPARR